MIRAFRAFWSALKDFVDEFLVLALCNGIWSLMSLPLLLITLVLLANGNPALAAISALLSVVPMAPATAGLAVIAHRVTEGRTSKIGDFIGGMRKYAVPAWKAMGLWMIGLLLLMFNAQFYAGMNNIFATAFLGLWLYLLVIWLGLLIYLFPLVLLQTTPGLRILARNAFLMTLGRPIFTLTTLVLMGLVLLITYFVPVLLPIITVALLAQWSMRATLALIKEAEERRAAAEATASSQPIVEEKGRRGQVRPK